MDDNEEVRAPVPTEPGWYAVRVENVGEVAEWGPRIDTYKRPANDPGRDQSWRGALAGLAEPGCTSCAGRGLLSSGDPCSCLSVCEPTDIDW